MAAVVELALVVDDADELVLDVVDVEVVCVVDTDDDKLGADWVKVPLEDGVVIVTEVDVVGLDKDDDADELCVDWAEVPPDSVAAVVPEDVATMAGQDWPVVGVVGVVGTTLVFVDVPVPATAGYWLDEAVGVKVELLVLPAIVA